MQKNQNQYYDPAFDNKEGYVMTIIGAAVGLVGLLVAVSSVMDFAKDIMYNKEWILSVTGIVVGAVGFLLGKMGGKKCGSKYKLFSKFAVFLGAAAMIFGVLFTFMNMGSMKR